MLRYASRLDIGLVASIVLNSVAHASTCDGGAHPPPEEGKSYNTFFIDTNPSRTIATNLYPSATQLPLSVTKRAHRFYSGRVGYAPQVSEAAERQTSSCETLTSKISGKLTYLERALLLADPGTFRERYAMSGLHNLLPLDKRDRFYAAAVEGGYVNYSEIMRGTQGPRRLSSPSQALEGFGDIFNVENYVNEKNIKALLGSSVSLIPDPVPKEAPDTCGPRLNDGVLTGVCRVHGRPCYVYSTNGNFFQGTITYSNAQKIVNLLLEATVNHGIVIGIQDSAGARVQEGVLSLAGFAKIFNLNTKLSGLVPQISLIMGSCAGGSVYGPALGDFVFMVDNTIVGEGEKKLTTGSHMFLTGPEVANAVNYCHGDSAQKTANRLSKTDLGGARLHTNISGCATCSGVNEMMTIARVRRLISYLPFSHLDNDTRLYPVVLPEPVAGSEHAEYVKFLKQQATVFSQINYGPSHAAPASERESVNTTRYCEEEHEGLLPDRDEAPAVTCGVDSRYRDCRCLNKSIPHSRFEPYNVYTNVLHFLFDKNSFFELQKNFARNMVCGFARLEGRVVVVIANNPEVLSGAIDSDASVKAARLVQFANSFGIPIVTVVDTPGFLPGKNEEEKGIIKHGAKLLHSYANCTVPIITIYTGKAYGGAYIAMGSRELVGEHSPVMGITGGSGGYCSGRAHYAWPTAAIAVLGQESVLSFMMQNKIRMGLEERYPYMFSEGAAEDAEVRKSYQRLHDQGFAKRDYHQIVLARKEGESQMSPSEDEINVGVIEYYLHQQFLTNYAEKYSNPVMAAQSRMVDSVIIPSETRLRICEDLDRFANTPITRSQAPGMKKQSNVPL